MIANRIPILPQLVTAVLAISLSGIQSVDGFSPSAKGTRMTKASMSQSALSMSIRPSDSTKRETITELSSKLMTEVEEETNISEQNLFSSLLDLGSLLPAEVDDHQNDEQATPYQEEEDKQMEIGIWAARGILLVVAILWGTNFASVKYLETLCFHPPCHHPPSEAALARFGVAGLVSLPLLAGQRLDIIKAGFECGLFITLGYVTQALALASIPSGKCAFICSLTVVVVPVLTAILYSKPIKPVSVVSALIALLGVGVLEGVVDVNSLLLGQSAMADDTAISAVSATTDIASSLTTSSTATITPGVMTSVMQTLKSLGIGKGDLMALGQPLGFGIAFMRIEHYVEKFRDIPNRIVTLSAAQCVVVGLLSAFWVLFDFGGHFPNMEYMIEPHRIGAILWTGIMTTVVAIYFEGVALQKASATEAALTFASEPVWATLFGAWLLHEKLSLTSYVGGAVILTACLLSAVADLPPSEEDDSITVEPSKD